VRTRTKVAIALGAGGSLFLAGIAPFFLMLLPNPRPVKVAGIADQPPGAYISTHAGTYHVFPSAEQLERFPDGSLSADPSAAVWVRFKQPDAPDAYGIYTFPEGKTVPVTRDASRPHLLQVRPSAPLSSGLYFARIAREGLLGGTDYVYFKVAR
jgi:hypothetical protein